MWFSVIVCSMARKQTLNRSQSLWSLIAVAHGPWPACFLLEKVPSTVECCWKWAYNPLLLLQTFEQNTTKKGWCSRFFFILQSNIWNFNKSPCPCIPLCWSASFIQVTRRKKKQKTVQSVWRVWQRPGLLSWQEAKISYINHDDSVCPEPHNSQLACLQLLGYNTSFKLSTEQIWAFILILSRR